MNKCGPSVAEKESKKKFITFSGRLTKKMGGTSETELLFCC